MMKLMKEYLIAKLTEKKMIKLQETDEDMYVMSDNLRFCDVEKVN